MRFKKFVFLAFLALTALASVGCDYASLFALDVGGVSVPNNSVTYNITNNYTFTYTNAADAAAAAAAATPVNNG